MAIARQDIVQLGLDLYHGKTSNLGNYNVSDAEEGLRKELLEVNGGNVNFKDFRRNKVEFFEIIEEVASQLIVEGIESQYQDLAEIRNLAWGDTNKFIVPNRQLFKIAVISDGNGNLRRQRLSDRGEFTVDVETRGIKIYEELYRFLAGRVNWKEMIDKIAKSWNIMMKNEIVEAVYSSFDATNNPKFHFSGAFDLTKFIEICQHVEAATGTEPVVYGTKLALSKVAPEFISDNMREKRNETGFWGVVNGIELREMKQAHKIGGTYEFALDDNFLMIMPQVEDKMVKIVLEGNAIIDEVQGGVNADMSKEYLFLMKMGIAVIPSAKFGIYKLA